MKRSIVLSFLFVCSAFCVPAHAGSLTLGVLDIKQSCPRYNGSDIRNRISEAVSQTEQKDNASIMQGLTTLQRMAKTHEQYRKILERMKYRANSYSATERAILGNSRQECVENARILSEPLFESVEHIVPLTEHANAGVRQAAAETIVKIDYLEERSLDAIIARLSDHNPQKRANAASTLQLLGTLAGKAENTLIHTAATDTAPDARIAAINALPAVAPLSDRAADTLESLYRSYASRGDTASVSIAQAALSALTALSQTNPKAAGILSTLTR